MKPGGSWMALDLGLNADGGWLRSASHCGGGLGGAVASTMAGRR